MAWFIAVLLIIVIIFGISSGMQSYATAQQAQAQIETAQAAQLASWGNLITILAIVLFVFLLVLLGAALLWLAYKRSVQRSTASQQRSQALPHEGQPQLNANELIMLIALKTLQDMKGPSAPNYLPAPTEEQPSDEPFSWLK